MCEKMANNGNRSKQKEKENSTKEVVYFKKNGNSGFHLCLEAAVSFPESQKIFWAQKVGLNMFVAFN